MRTLWDVIAAVGLCLLTLGLWWIYPPAALIALGLVFAGVGVWGAKLWAS